ncbi:MAG: glycosyltransferase family 39 protein [Bacteroidales bacterium]|nr:glycosyltransferase family 39 protein [Bacteroidales bacterium]
MAGNAIKKIINYIQTNKYKIWIFLVKNKYLLLILLLASFVRLWGLFEPFGKIWETSFQAYIAKNHYTHGLLYNHFASVIGYNSDGPIYHLSHPPLLQIIIYIYYLIFGLYDWVAKLVPITFSLVSLLLLYLIVIKVWKNKKMALYASFIFALMPMASHFGKVVNFEVPTLFFSLLYFYCYLNLDKKNAKWPLVLLFVSAFCGSLLDWPFYFMIVAVFLHSFFKKKNRKIILISTCFSAIIFLSFILYIDTLGYKFNLMFNKFKSRGRASVICEISFYKTIAHRIYSYFNITALFVLASIVAFFSNKKIRKFIQNLDIVLLLLFQPIIYSILFLQSVSMHAWHLYYFVPIVCIVTGIFLEKLSKRINFWYKPLLFALLSVFVLMSVNILYKYNIAYFEPFNYKLGSISK